MENILARRSIRKFTDQPVPRRLVETLVKAGINAPSGHNLQTWRFTVLTNQAEIQRLESGHPAGVQAVQNHLLRLQ